MNIDKEAQEAYNNDPELQRIIKEASEGPFVEKTYEKKRNKNDHRG